VTLTWPEVGGGRRVLGRLVLSEESNNKCRPYDVMGDPAGCPAGEPGAACEAKMKACAAQAESTSRSVCRLVFVDACRGHVAAHCGDELREVGIDDPLFVFGPSRQPSKSVAQLVAAARASLDVNEAHALLAEATTHAEADGALWLELADFYRDRLSSLAGANAAAVRAAHIGEAAVRRRAYLMLAAAQHSYAGSGTSWSELPSSDEACRDQAWLRRTSPDETCLCWSRPPGEGACPAACQRSKPGAIVFIDACHHRLGTSDGSELTR
jgi:hypothetical protein